MHSFDLQVYSIPDLSKMVDGLLFLNLPKTTINAWRSNWLPRNTQDFLTPVTVCLSPCPSPLAAQRPQRVRGKPRSLCQGGRANGGRGASQEEFVVLAPDAGGWHQGILRSGADQCFDRSWCACSLLLLALMMLLGFGWKMESTTRTSALWKFCRMTDRQIYGRENDILFWIIW